jgi:hypothetical protein
VTTNIGMKYDGDKPRYDLEQVKATEEVIKVLTFGAAKYSSYDIIPKLAKIGDIELLCNVATVTKGIKSRPNQLGSVNHAQTKEKSMTTEFVHCVTKAEKSGLKKQVSADAATTKDSKERTRNISNDNETTTRLGSLKTNPELKSTRKKDRQTLLAKLGIKQLNGILCYQNTVLTSSNMTVWLREGVTCVDEQTEHHTLTTATAQAGLEGFFVVGATTDSECLEIIYKVLRELSLISDKSRERHYSADNNWRLVDKARSRYLAAARRHMAAYNLDESRDPESGLHHLAHAICCLNFILELELDLEQKDGV